MEASQTKFRMPHMKAEGFALDQAPDNLRTMDALKLQGISMDEASDTIRYVMDAMPTVTAGSAPVPVQFLQHWMNKFITVVTQATTADEFLGRTTQGEWFQKSVVLTVRELTGNTAPYGDRAAPPLAGYNINEEERDIVRFAQGILTGKLEEMRLAAMGMKLSAYESDRAAIGQAFNLDTNAVAFYGYNLGNNKTYGILNDPNLDPFIQVATFTPDGGSPTGSWSEKGFYGIVRDLNTAVGALQKKCGGNFIPSKAAFKIGVALGCDTYLNSVNEHGNRSVRDYIKDTWPKAEIVPIPEFDNAVGGDNVFYIKLEELGKNPVAEQIVPAAVRLVGMEPRATGVYELYSNATAGCFVEQPLGIVRYFGI
ncbi:MAG: DUF2184 domain-containing protein [Bacteroidales bacterium]|nr:DUF2184 domain-containing protein [Bacteroidales bacterium]